MVFPILCFMAWLLTDKYKMMFMTREDLSSPSASSLQNMPAPPSPRIKWSSPSDFSWSDCWQGRAKGCSWRGNNYYCPLHFQRIIYPDKLYQPPPPFLRIKWWVSEYWLLNVMVQSTLFQLYMWRHVDVQADWRISLTYGKIKWSSPYDVSYSDCWQGKIKGCS